MKASLKKLTMPLAVAVTAIAGAFTTTSMSSNDAFDQRLAYKQLSNTCESQQFMCQTETGDICKSVDDVTLWGKPSIGASTCTVPLYHID